MIVLDYRDRRPIYEQVTEKLENLIIKGVLTPDTQLPSVRKLAMDLSINPNTIQRAYALLEQHGFVYSVKGKGSFVAPNNQLVEIQKVKYIEEFQRIVEQGKNIGITKKELENELTKSFMEG